MKFQLALDVRSMDEAQEMLDAAGDYADLIEIGSPLVMAEGMSAVKYVRKKYPDKPILADCKIMDASAYMVPKAAEAGANIVTVLAAAHDFTLQEHVRVCHELGMKAAVDLIQIPTDKLEAKMEELADFGFDYFFMHAPSEALRPTEPLQITRIKKMLKVIPHTKLCIAHSLDYKKLEQVLAFKPEYTVVSLPIMHGLTSFGGNKAMREEAALKVRQIFDRCNKIYK